MSRRQEECRFRTSPAPARLFASSLSVNDDSNDARQAPPARINLALSGWLRDRFPAAPLPLASLAAATATATTTTAPRPPPTSSSYLRFELAAAKDDDDDGNQEQGGDGGLVGQKQQQQKKQQRSSPALPEAPDSAVAALDGLGCNACGVRLVPERGETSDQRRRRAAALTRVCAGCRQTFHEGCAREVARMLGGRVLLRLQPGQPTPWQAAPGGPQGDGGLLAALTGQMDDEEAVRTVINRKSAEKTKKTKKESVSEELERMLREEEVVRAAVARDGHWFHSFSCARVAAALAAQASVGAVAIDAVGDGKGAGEEEEGAKAAAKAVTPAAAAARRPTPFQWLKDMREAEIRKLGEPLDLSSSEEEEEQPEGAAAAAPKKQKKKKQRPAPPAAAPPRPLPPPPPPRSSRTWALIDLSRLRAEPGDPPGPKGPGKGLRPDVDALVDVLLQAYGPGAADLVVGLPAALALGEEDGEGQQQRQQAPQRRRLGGGLRDGRYAVLLRDSADNGAAPLCAALLDSYGPQAAVVGLLATRVLRRGEGHAAALLDATADFLRDGLGTRQMLAAGVPAASDPVCKGLFLGKGGEKAVRREQERVQAELKRQRERDAAGGQGGQGQGPDLVTGLLAVMGNPSLAPFVSKETIYWSPPHAPRFRRLARGEARRLAAELPALARRFQLSGVKVEGGGGGGLARLFGGGSVAAGEDGREWLVKDLCAG
jgi:hypothetical protein